MSIKIIKTPGKPTVIETDRGTFTAKELAEYLGITPNAIHKRVYNGEAEEWITAWLWKHDRGIPPSTRVYNNGHEMLTFDMVKEINPRVVTKVLYKLLNRWTKGEISTGELYELTRKSKTESPEERRARKEAEKRLFANLQPRRSIDDLPGPGTWEKENCGGDTFHKGGGRNPQSIEHLFQGTEVSQLMP
jgi:hypothetical protein